MIYTPSGGSEDVGDTVIYNITVRIFNTVIYNITCWCLRMVEPVGDSGHVGDNKHVGGNEHAANGIIKV